MTLSKVYKRFLKRPGMAMARAVAAPLNVGLAMVTVFSAWGGEFDPAVCVFASLAAMALPLVLLAGLIVAVVDLILFRKALVVLGTGWVASLSPILAFAPVNIGHTALTPDEEERAFTFMTYNVLHYWDFRGEVDSLHSNATIDYILAENADIVSLQEADYLHEWPLWKITPEQLRELAEHYPFRAIAVGEQFTVLSRYPFVEDRVQVPEQWKTKMSFYRISMRGEVLHLANCHFEGIGLDPTDKQLYQSLLEKYPRGATVMRREVREVKERLITKLQSAFMKRREQAAYVRHVIDSIGGNWIVAGDFNDIPSCYAVRTIMGDDFHDVYAEEALGPTITYHGNQFYFRIDQMLYRGNFRAADITRPKIPSSDHYPLIGTFVWDK